ncbi:MAG TPA: hypothetical protein VK009_12130 [Chloroflexota bacterium]|nr:hypothetical protein [Chloroflexota bacterium]
MAKYDEAAASRAAMWTYIWVMVGFKVITAGFVLYFTHAFGFWAIMLALHLPWIAAALILAGAPGAAYWRLVKMRARRAELIRQEFNVIPPEQELRDPVTA